MFLWRRGGNSYSEMDLENWKRVGFFKQKYSLVWWLVCQLCYSSIVRRWTLVWMFLFLFLETESRCCRPGWSLVVWSQLTWNLCFLGSGNSPASASQVAGITGACHYGQLIFIFLVETDFVILARLVSNVWPHGLPASASQSAGITGVSHSAQPNNLEIY